MIGGPSDVVVETNIVRAHGGATRDAPARPATAATPHAARMPLPDPTPWPLQPETGAAPARDAAAAARRSRRALPSDDAWQTPAEPAVAAQPVPEVRAVRPADTLAGLAEDLARPTEPIAVRPVQVQPQRACARPARRRARSAASPPPTRASPRWRSGSKPRCAGRRRRRSSPKRQRVTATVEIKAAPPKAAVRAAAGRTPDPSSRAISSKKWRVF